METAVQEKWKPMGISSAQTELLMLSFIPMLGSAEVFTHQACGGENLPDGKNNKHRALLSTWSVLITQRI